VGGEPVIPLSLAQIAQITGGQLTGPPEALVTGEVVIDSRRAGPGGLFAALAGERSDGHDFAAAAVAAGAVAALVTRPVPVSSGSVSSGSVSSGSVSSGSVSSGSVLSGSVSSVPVPSVPVSAVPVPSVPVSPVFVPSVLVRDVPAALAALAAFVVDALPSLRIVGITGSSGKTSTKDLAAQLAERLGPTIAPAGSYNNELGHPLTVLRVDAATQNLVLELSARGVGHIAYLCRIAPPRYGAVLNVGHAHEGEFGGLDQIARAKGELVEALPADGVAILNADDPRVLAMASRTAARVVTFSAGPDLPYLPNLSPLSHLSSLPQPSALSSHVPQPTILAADVRLDDLGRPSFTLLTPEGSAPVTLRLHGAHNVPNALAAAALARELGLSLADIADGLSAAVARSRWRMEVHRRADGVTVINDAYNANPESVRAALEALGHLAQGGRAFAVLGHMAELGDTSPARHVEAGEFAARVLGPALAGLIAVGPEAAPLLDGARRVPSWPGEALGVPDGPAALAVLADRLKPGDVVLVKASRAVRLEGVAADLLLEADQ
jgi:UDP-N-acetylmuramoyl-tripeptide--D-alanyl-D-alanine ligase